MMVARRVAIGLLLGLALVAGTTRDAFAQTDTLPLPRQNSTGSRDIPIGVPMADLFVPAHLLFLPTVSHAMSCPVFVGGGTMLGEDTCVWTKLTGERTNHGSTGADSVGWRFGGQAEIAPGWFLGGAAGTIGTSASTAAGPSSQKRSFDGSVVVKRVDGPLLLAAALSFMTTSQQTVWPVPAPGGGSVNMVGNSSELTGGMRLRGAWTFAFDGWYLRPRAEADVAITSNSGLQETGPAPPLTLDGWTRTTIALSPALELGGRIDVGPSTILRPYVVGGAIFLPDNNRTISGTNGGVRFSGVDYGPAVMATVEAGLQLYQVKGWEMKLDYRLAAGNSILSQTLGLRGAWHF